LPAKLAKMKNDAAPERWRSSGIEAATHAGRHERGRGAKLTMAPREAEWNVGAADPAQRERTVGTHCGEAARARLTFYQAQRRSRGGATSATRVVT
jgi:hypothetical protein